MKFIQFFSKKKKQNEYIIIQKSYNNINKFLLGRNVKFMKFVKGMVIGTMVSAGIALMYMESTNRTKKTIMKKGKQMAKKMGIV